jgi:diguanylate cyclase (GGDEF)-like protein/PAS domain S-box-containing protein
LKLTLQEYRTIVANAPNLIWRAGTDTKCNFFNKTWLAFTGRTMKQELGEGWAEGVFTDDVERCVQTYLEAFANRKPFEMEYRLRRHDGEWRWISDHGAPYHGEDGAFAGYIGSCMDVTDRVEGNLYKEQAQRDSLTGVYSRQYLLSQIQRYAELARNQGAKLTLAMLDIDRFKQINDTYGHLTGDKVLKMFAQTVQHYIRETDLLGRYGGDEFVIAFWKADRETAESIIHRIHDGLREIALISSNEDILLTMCCGLCEYRENQTVEDMLHDADREMYVQKRNRLTESRREGDV